MRLGQKTGHYHPSARHPSHSPSASTSTVADVTTAHSHSPSDAPPYHEGSGSGSGMMNRNGNGVGGEDWTSAGGITISTDYPNTHPSNFDREDDRREEVKAKAPSTSASASSVGEQGRSRWLSSWSALSDLSVSVWVDSIRNPVVSATSSVYSYFYSAKPSSLSALDEPAEQQRRDDDVMMEDDRKGDRITSSVTIDSDP